jgi:FKBP-type peptidyl-prolyl cis-trans isomerase (trigger factor)
MVELGITEPALRKDIEGEILIQGHLSKAVDTSKITVTEKELTDAYAQISGTQATGVTVPPLAEIKTQLEAQLKTNKEQELVNAYITKIREGATIEVLI